MRLRSRTWIGIIALLSVLLHAGAIVRHNGVMLGATFQYQALLGDLARICHSAGTTADVPAADLPAIPKPSDAQNGCPLCSGLASAFALIGPEPAAIVLPQPVAPVFHVRAIVVPSATHAVHPPARGPPALA
jgi:hypothetical protein